MVPLIVGTACYALLGAFMALLAWCPETESDREANGAVRRVITSPLRVVAGKRDS